LPNLPNTIVLPEDTNGANQMLDQLLVDPAAAIYLFIFGNSQQITQFAAAADGVASGALRKVVRRSQCADILNRFTALQIDPALPPLSSANLVGFSTSGHLFIADVILGSDMLDVVRASDAFMRAEAA
jgi:hypothetical protein